MKNKRKDIMLRGTLVKKEKFKLTLDLFGKKGTQEILIGKDKTFNLTIGEMYRFTCGMGDDGVLWLNQRVLLELITKEEFEETIGLSIIIPKNCEDWRQFNTDKRTALMCSIDFHKGKGRTYTEEQVNLTARKFLAELTNNLGGKKEA